MSYYVGKYSGVFAMPNLIAARNYIDCCIKETVHAGFHPAIAANIEHGNLLNHAAKFGSNAVSFIEAAIKG